MTHFSVLVLGDVESQLSIYDENLQVERYKSYLTNTQVDSLVAHYDLAPDDMDGIAEMLPEWTGDEGGVDDEGVFHWSTFNPRARWDWWILGGRWTGYLRLRVPGTGELGKAGAGLKDKPLRYGEYSADRALFGDIDWHGMAEYHMKTAETEWQDALAARDRGDPWEMVYGIEPGWTMEEFLHYRSHVATFAVVKDSDWYERGNVGWWGIVLDADPVAIWHARFEALLSTCQPDTLVSVVDCHI